MDIFFVEDPSIKQRVKARSFVAKNALKRRIRQQEAAKNTSSTLLCSRVVDGLRSGTSHFDEAGSHQEAIDVLLPLPESRPVTLTLDGHRTIATTNNGEPQKPKGIWGVSSAICPNPAHAARSAFRNSAVASFIQEASNMFQKAKFAKMNGAGEQNRLHISALTSRGEAMKLARQQFSAMDDRQELSISNQTRQNLKAESQFLVILQLVLMDYIFFPKQARAHFAASRRFLRSCQAASDESTIVTKRMPKFIHNHAITQIVVAFDIVHLGPDSLIWERSDLPELQESLRAFMMKLYEAESSTEPVNRRQPLDPQSLVWRSLTKIPGPNPYDRGSYLSESQGQMAAILMICSIYLHYQPSSNVPQQSLSDLESAMVSLGDEALLSVLNLAWMMAGGTGLPIDNRRERLYWTTGMLYIFRCQQYPLDDDSDLMKRIDNQSEFTENDVRNACLRFLGGNID